MKKLNLKSLLSGLTHFWKDLVLLVLGIYLALWMENYVQSLNEDEKQKQYLLRLAEDLKSDISQMENLTQYLSEKIAKLESSIVKIQKESLDVNDPQVQNFTLELASAVNTYFFFDPQEFTYLSMRESGDFKLIDNEALKTRLIKLYSNYKKIDVLQKNYQQGLDDEFIPLWIRNVNVLKGELVNKDLITDPLFVNMVAFAYNETNTRNSLIVQILELVKKVVVELESEASRL